MDMAKYQCIYVNISPSKEKQKDEEGMKNIMMKRGDSLSGWALRFIRRLPVWGTQERLYYILGLYKLDTARRHFVCRLYYKQNILEMFFIYNI